MMIGIGTALGDDPLLTVRQNGLDQRNLRVVLDSALRLPLGSRLVATAGDSDAGDRRRARAGERREAELRARGVEVARVAAGARRPAGVGRGAAGPRRAGRHAGVQRGRPEVGAALIRAGLADEVCC